MISPGVIRISSCSEPMKRATAAAWGRSSTSRFGKAHTDGSDAAALGSERRHEA